MGKKRKIQLWTHSCINVSFDSFPFSFYLCIHGNSCFWLLLHPTQFFPMDMYQVFFLILFSMWWDISYIFHTLLCTKTSCRDIVSFNFRWAPISLFKPTKSNFKNLIVINWRTAWIYRFASMKFMCLLNCHVQSNIERALKRSGGEHLSIEIETKINFWMKIYAFWVQLQYQEEKRSTFRLPSNICLISIAL